MSFVIRNTTIVACDTGRTVHHDAAIAIDGDRIAAVGPSDEIARQFPNAEMVDGRGKAVFPGLANCHTHLTLTVARGIQEDFGFPSVLRFPTTVLALMTPEERTVFALLGALESIRSGATAIMEIAENIQAYVEPLAGTGLRLVCAENAADLVPDGISEGRFEFSSERRESALQRIDDLITRWHGAADGRVTCFVSAHAPEACSPELLRRARDLAERRDTGYTVHLDQSRWEIEAVMRVRGVRPAEYLFQQDFLGPRLVAGHCRYMAPSEIALIGHSRAFVSHNAAMAARRGVAPPIQALEAAGCAIAMGTDNMAEDMIEAMRAGLFMERVTRDDGLHPWPEDVLEWAARNGARALGLGEQTGSLEPGKKADLFIVDTRRAHLVPTTRIVSGFIHNGQAGDIESVMVDGRWLMRDGRVLTIDEADIIERAEEIGQRLWRQLVERYPDVPFPIRLPDKR